MSKIEGPLGLWPFPVLNALVEISENRTGGGVQITEVNRDSNGKIQSIERIEE